MHYECRNGNYLVAGNNCPRIGHHFQVATAAGRGYKCDVCVAKLVRVVPPGKGHGGKKLSFLSKGVSIRYRPPKGRNSKSTGKRHRVNKTY
jgi:hypothetical protein